MTFEDLLSHIGTGAKHLTDRYSDYAGPIHEHEHDHHVFYAYEPSAPASGHATTSKHNYGGGHHKSGAMSALTLLAFLFFLHILQQCIKDHMMDMSAAQQPVVVMTAGREGEETVSKSALNKIDKFGITRTNVELSSENEKINSDTQNKINVVKNSYDYDDSVNKKELMKVRTTNYEIKSNEQKYKYAHNNSNRNSFFPGFVSAMDNEY